MLQKACKIIFPNIFKNYSSLKCQTINKDILTKSIPKTKNEQLYLSKLPPEQFDQAKFLKVSIIGLPNSGKSTLINKLMNWRVLSESRKVHTTRKNIVSVFTNEDIQLAFYDTPGLVNKKHCKKHNLDIEMSTLPQTAAKDADIICVVVDASNIWTRHKLDLLTLDILQQNKDKKSILILNKVDLIHPKSLLLDTVKCLTNGYFRGQSQPEILVSNKTPEFTPLKDKFSNKFDDDNMQQRENKNSDECEIKRPEILRNLEALEKLRYARRTIGKMSSVKNSETNQPNMSEMDKIDINEEDHIISSAQLIEKDYINKDLPKTIPTIMKSHHVHDKTNSLVYSNHESLDPKIFEDAKNLPLEPNSLKRETTSWPNFHSIFMVSALDNDGLDELMDCLMCEAPYQAWKYNSQYVTDQQPEQIVIDAIRQELLNHLNFQIPYILNIKIIEYYIQESGLLRIRASIKCPKDNLMKIIIGPSGERIRKISDKVSQSLMDTFRCDVYISLEVAVEKNRT